MTLDHPMHIHKCKAINIDKQINIGKSRPVPKVKSNRRNFKETLRIHRILHGPFLGKPQPSPKSSDKRRRGISCPRRFIFDWGRGRAH